MEDSQEPSTSKGDKPSIEDIKSRIRLKTAKIHEKLREKKNIAIRTNQQNHVSQGNITRNIEKPERRNSRSSTISASSSSKTQSLESEKTKRKRQRNRAKKDDRQQSEREEPSMKLDPESELIVQLLSLKPAKREDFLLRRAENKGLIIFNKATKSYKLNEKLIPCGANSTQQDEKKPKSRNLELSKTLKFESYVNEVILEGIPEKEHKKYNFLFENRDKKLPHNEMYINQPDFVQRLQKHAEYCAKENLGEIIEGELRISNVNYYHAFVTRNESNGKKDAMVCSKVARKFALHGDIVRCFVRNSCMYIFLYSSKKYRINQKQLFINIYKIFDNLFTNFISNFKKNILSSMKRNFQLR